MRRAEPACSISFFFFASFPLSLQQHIQTLLKTAKSGTKLLLFIRQVSRRGGGGAVWEDGDYLTVRHAAPWLERTAWTYSRYTCAQPRRAVLTFSRFSASYLLRYPRQTGSRPLSYGEWCYLAGVHAVVLAVLACGCSLCGFDRSDQQPKEVHTRCTAQETQPLILVWSHFVTVDVSRCLVITVNYAAITPNRRRLTVRFVLICLCVLVLRSGPELGFMPAAPWRAPSPNTRMLMKIRTHEDKRINNHQQLQ